MKVKHAYHLQKFADAVYQKISKLKLQLTKVGAFFWDTVYNRHLFYITVAAFQRHQWQRPLQQSSSAAVDQ